MSSAEELAILRIELAEIEPLIWRRVAVRTSTNLQTLHKIIQAAMGWLDYHLWEFTVDDVISTASPTRTMPVGDTRSNAPARPNLRNCSTAASRRLSMFTTWATTGSIESSLSALSPLRRRGRRCLPEDCGGVPGTYEFLDAIAGPDKGNGRKEKKEALDWYGRPYNPDDIDEEQIRSTLKRIANASRPRRPKPPQVRE